MAAAQMQKETEEAPLPLRIEESVLELVPELCEEAQWLPELLASVEEGCLKIQL